MIGRYLRILCGLVIAAGTAGRAAAEELVIASWGSAYQDAQRKAYFEPFTRKTGIKIVEATGPDAAKIRAMTTAGNPEWDVVDIALPTAIILNEQNLLERIDYGPFTPAARDGMMANFKLPYAVGNETWSVVIAYRKDRVKEPPKSWSDFWNVEKFPGKRAFLDSTFVAPVAELALAADGVGPGAMYPVDIERAFKSFSKIRKDVVKWTGSSGVMQQLLVDGEVDFGAIANGRIEGMEKAGVPIGYTFSQQLILANYWAVPKGAKNAVNAMKFIAFASEAEQQANFANLAPWGPTNRDAYKLLSKERQAQLPTAPENMANAIVSDNEWWSAKQGGGRSNLDNYLRAWNAWWLAR